MKPVVVASAATDVIVAAAAVGGHNQRLVGFSATENAGAAATVLIYHGQDATGVLLFDVRLASGESARELALPGNGIPIPNGIFIDRTGTSRLTFFIEER